MFLHCRWLCGGSICFGVLCVSAKGVCVCVYVHMHANLVGTLWWHYVKGKWVVAWLECQFSPLSVCLRESWSHVSSMPMRECVLINTQVCTSILERTLFYIRHKVVIIKKKLHTWPDGCGWMCFVAPVTTVNRCDGVLEYTCTLLQKSEELNH